jgi:hypothetical protein
MSEFLQPNNCTSPLSIYYIEVLRTAYVTVSLTPHSVDQPISTPIHLSIRIHLFHRQKVTNRFM